VCFVVVQRLSDLGTDQRRALLELIQLAQQLADALEGGGVHGAPRNARAAQVMCQHAMRQD
jgi:hypothetical protein